MYGKRGRNYKYLTFTHNIDPDEVGKSTYVKKKYGISVASSFEAPDKKYRIHEDDLPTVKRYKK